MRRILVTGGAGFIGSNFVRLVLDTTDDAVTVLDALTYAGNPASLTGLDERRYRFVQGSVADAALVDELVAGHDLVVHFAATRIGAVSNPLIPIYRDREVGFMVALAESKLLVVPAEFRGYDYAAMANRLRPEWPALQQVLVLGGEPGTAGSWADFAATPWEQQRDPAGLAALRPDPNDVTLLMFTCGTTGEPKGVMHTHNTLVAANAPLPARLGVGAGSVIHMPPPSRT